MIQKLPSLQRGHTTLPWLDSRHSFSFGSYHDPSWMGWNTVRVINEDLVAPGSGFGSHPHRDMEILTIVLSGELTHKDSLGTEVVLTSGEAQRMSAGTGIVHSEWNTSPTEVSHFLQIWITPRQRGLPPSHEQAILPVGPGFHCIASPEGMGGALTIHQDTAVYLLRLSPQMPSHQVQLAGQDCWVQVVRGEISLNAEVNLSAGDGAQVEREVLLTISGLEFPAEALLFTTPRVER